MNSNESNIDAVTTTRDIKPGERVAKKALSSKRKKATSTKRKRNAGSVSTPSVQLAATGSLEVPLSPLQKGTLVEEICDSSAPLKDKQGAEAISSQLGLQPDTSYAFITPKLIPTLVACKETTVSGQAASASDGEALSTVNAPATPDHQGGSTADSFETKSPATQLSEKQLFRLLRAEIKNIIDSLQVKVTSDMGINIEKTRSSTSKVSKIPNKVLIFTPPSCFIPSCRAEINSLDQAMAHWKECHNIRETLSDRPDLLAKITDTFTEELRLKDQRFAFEGAVFGVDFFFADAEFIDQKLLKESKQKDDAVANSPANTYSTVSKKKKATPLLKAKNIYSIRPTSAFISEAKPDTESIFSNIIDEDIEIITDLESISLYTCDHPTYVDGERLPLFTSRIINGGKSILCNTGPGALWALDCHPTLPLVACGGHSQPYNYAPLSPNPPYPNTLQIWDTNNGNITICILHDFGSVWDISWMHHGNVLEESRIGLLAACFGDGKARVFQITKKMSGMPAVRIIRPIFEGGDSVWKLGWGENVNVIALGGFDGTVSVYGIIAGNLLYSFAPHDCAVRRLSWFDAYVLATSGDDGKVTITDVRDLNTVMQVARVQAPIFAIAWQKDGMIIYQDHEAVRISFPMESIPNNAVHPSSSAVCAHNSTVWDVSVSDLISFTASGGIDGCLKISNYNCAIKDRKKPTFVSIYKIVYNRDTGYSYIEDLEDEMPSLKKKKATEVGFEIGEPAASIHRIAWSKSVESGADLLVSAAASGLLRFDRVFE